MSKVFLASPHLFGNERKYVQEALDSNWIAPLGPFVNKAEEIVEGIINKPCAAVSSGTAALHLAVIEAGIKSGDVVVASDMTFTASVNPAIYQGAKVVFVDSEPETFNIDPAALEKAIMEFHPKAAIISHIYGIPSDYRSIEICKKHGVTVIEDAAEVMGSTVRGMYAGANGDFGAFSFNGNKIVTGSMGGMVICSSSDEKKHIVNLSTQAKSGDPSVYIHNEIGYNYRMSNITAAILCGQLEILRDKIAIKKKINDCYIDALDDFEGCYILKVPADRTSNYWLSILVTDDDTGALVKDIIKFLDKNDIQARRVWTPLHDQPVFEGCDFVSMRSGMSVSEEFFNRSLCLPSDENMSEEDQMRVISIIKDTIAKKKEGRV